MHGAQLSGMLRTVSVPAYVVIELRVHYAGHDWTLTRPTGMAAGARDGAVNQLPVETQTPHEYPLA